MVRHVNRVHLRKRPFSCREDGCHQKFFSKRDMDGHVDVVHLKKKPFKCSNCSKEFGNKWHLSNHIKVVHQKELLCQELGCEKKFGIKGCLEDHMRSTHGAPKLVCKKAECSATFVWRSQLFRHVKGYHWEQFKWFSIMLSCPAHCPMPTPTIEGFVNKRAYNDQSKMIDPIPGTEMLSKCLAFYRTQVRS